MWKLFRSLEIKQKKNENQLQNRIMQKKKLMQIFMMHFQKVINSFTLELLLQQLLLSALKLPHSCLKMHFSVLYKKFIAH